MMSLDDKAVASILIAQHYLDDQTLRTAQSQAEKKEMSVIDQLLSDRLITRELLGQAIAESFHLKFADLPSSPPNEEQTKAIPGHIANQLRAVLFQSQKERVVIATDQPNQPDLKEKLQPFFVGQNIDLAYCFSEDIDKALAKAQTSLASRFLELIKTDTKVAPGVVNQIIEDALAHQASDIHLEPKDEEVVIRFRIDGLLQSVGRFPLRYYHNVLNRLKIQAKLRIDEHLTVQDGAIRYQIAEKLVDIRVSVAPTLAGEKVVLRLLNRYVSQLSLDELGFSAKNQELLEQAVRRPFGMIVVAGPTGSGKTTTLYGLLKAVAINELNVTTIEDPVEYRTTGINQIQVNRQAGITFASGLRSIVRQDPDVILVGEIRDRETAEIAVNSALTGHLILTTFHANDAATAIPRLLDMGVEPFLLSSTVELIIAQRLVRRLCNRCRLSQASSKSSLEKKFPGLGKFFSASQLNLYRGKGCQSCGGTGYVGRTALVEVMVLTPELRELILARPTIKEIWKVAAKSGCRTMFEDGFEKAQAGLTTLEEVFRVASPPSQ